MCVKPRVNRCEMVYTAIIEHGLVATASIAVGTVNASKSRCESLNVFANLSDVYVAKWF